MLQVQVVTHAPWVCSLMMVRYALGEQRRVNHARSISRGLLIPSGLRGGGSFDFDRVALAWRALPMASSFAGEPLPFRK